MERNNRRNQESKPRRSDDRPPRAKHERRRSRSPAYHDNPEGRATDRSNRWPDNRDKSRNTDRHKNAKPPTGPRQRSPAASNTRPRESGRGDGRDGARKGTTDNRHNREKSSAESRQAASAMQIDDTSMTEEEQMQHVMGFANFRSTKNTKVPGNDKNWAVSRTKKIQARQYMNRVGGFNRPLSPGRS